MIKYREIPRLKSLESSKQNIVDSCNVSKKTSCGVGSPVVLMQLGLQSQEWIRERYQEYLAGEFFFEKMLPVVGRYGWRNYESVYSNSCIQARRIEHE